MSSPLQTNITNLQELLERANSLPEEIVLPTLSNPATSSDMLLGKQLINADCEVVTGTIPSQEAQTITPSTSNKTIASGRYLTGTQTIEGDSNLKAENIKSGVSIFGVTGTHESGIDVKTATGQIRTSRGSASSTTCGFKPDMVSILLEPDNEGGNGVVAFNAVFNDDYCYCTAYCESFSYPNVYAEVEATSSGFRISGFNKYNDDWDSTTSSGETYSYIAIKYTA